MTLHDEGGLISDFFSFFLKYPIICFNSLYHLKKGSDLAPSFGDLSQSENFLRLINLYISHHHHFSYLFTGLLHVNVRFGRTHSFIN